MTNITLRPDKYYSATELSKVLGLAPYDLFILISRSEIIFKLIDNQAVYQGAEIQNLINSKQCITPVTSRSTGTS